MKTPTAMTSADAINYFDSMTHPFESLACHYFGLHIEHIVALFLSIKFIKMNFKTGYMMSDSFYAGTDSRSFQGRIQESYSVGPN